MVKVSQIAPIKREAGEGGGEERGREGERGRGGGGDGRTGGGGGGGGEERRTQERSVRDACMCFTYAHMTVSMTHFTF